MHGNRVVRAIEVQGDLLAALRHVAKQPEVREVEEAINPYLEQDRDLNDPNSARVFFTRAALPAVHHVAADGQHSAELTRHALYYPAKEGCGMALARLLAKQDEAAAQSPDSPIASSTIFQRDDIVVRLVDMTGKLEAQPALALGMSGPRKAATLARLLAVGEEGVSETDKEMARFLKHSAMELITDRNAPPES